MKMNAWLAVGAVVWLVAANGCASSAQRPVYSPSQTGHIIREERGEIVAVRDVTIAPPAPAGGAGRRIGAGIGAGVATGSIERAAAAIGSVIGGDIGAKADEKAGEEITIRLNTEEVIIVVQERGEAPLAVGEKVRVLTSAPPSGGIGRVLGGATGGGTRVERESHFAAEWPAVRGGIAAARTSGSFPSR